MFKDVARLRRRAAILLVEDEWGQYGEWRAGAFDTVKEDAVRGRRGTRMDRAEADGTEPTTHRLNQLRQGFSAMNEGRRPARTKGLHDETDPTVERFGRMHMRTVSAGRLRHADGAMFEERWVGAGVIETVRRQAEAVHCCGNGCYIADAEVRAISALISFGVFARKGDQVGVNINSNCGCGGGAVECAEGDNTGPGADIQQVRRVFTIQRQSGGEEDGVMTGAQALDRLL
ncbi:MAG: hypothetical protein AAFZ01_02785 [Pseudomonadota bacterium]